MPNESLSFRRRAHEELLVNWVPAKGEISSASWKGLNNKIRVVTTRSYGFRSFDAMEIALYHTLGRLTSRKQPTDSAEEALPDVKVREQHEAGWRSCLDGLMEYAKRVLP